MSGSLLCRAEEAARLLLIWLSSVGGALAFEHNRHSGMSSCSWSASSWSPSCRGFPVFVLHFSPVP